MRRAFLVTVWVLMMTVPGWAQTGPTIYVRGEEAAVAVNLMREIDQCESIVPVDVREGADYALTYSRGRVQVGFGQKSGHSWLTDADTGVTVYRNSTDIFTNALKDACIEAVKNHNQRDQ